MKSILSGNKAIKIGKYTLESLTTGMYIDPLIIYREYIQNAVDSIENAINQSLLNKDDARINIYVDSNLKKISICDNGTGITAKKVYSLLTAIGNSNKKHVENRGFRGIGRLGGLSYCNKLLFVTSYKGESSKSIVEFDCERLKELLIPGNYDDYDLSKVLEEVITTSSAYEDKQAHYFRVEMQEVEDDSILLNLEKVEGYIAQVGPLPYSPEFFWGGRILHTFEENDFMLSEFPIYLGTNSNDLRQLYKPNAQVFISDMSKKIEDEIKGIKTFSIKSNDNHLVAIGWYAECAWNGSIVNREISGLRMRKGNILIGTSKTMGSLFKEERFNSWVQGEVFIVSDKLIPNARRDDFEQNETYKVFIDEITVKVGVEISKKIREASKVRNDFNDKKLDAAQKTLTKAFNYNNEGFNSELEKENLKKELELTIEELKPIKSKSKDQEKSKKITLKDLTSLYKATEKSKNLKINKIKKLDAKSKKVLKVVSNVLTQNLTKENVDMLIEEIILELNSEG